MFPHLGEIALISIIVIMIFGVSRLPQISEQLARGKRAFKKELEGDDKAASKTSSEGDDIEDAQTRPGQ